MKQTVSVNALPIVELPSVAVAQVLNALHRVINPAVKAVKANAWVIASVLIALVTLAASFYEMATDSLAARIVTAVGAISGVITIFAGLPPMEGGEA